MLNNENMQLLNISKKYKVFNKNGNKLNNMGLGYEINNNFENTCLFIL